MKAAKGDATMLKGHAADQRAVGEESNVHGRKGEQSVHHIRRGGTDSEETGEGTCQLAVRCIRLLTQTTLRVSLTLECDESTE